MTLTKGAQLFRDWMQREKLSQREVAQSLGWDSTYVSAIVNGRRRPQLNNAFKIQELTKSNVPVDSWIQLKKIRASK